MKEEPSRMNRRAGEGSDSYVVQDVVPLLAGGDLDELAQEEGGALGDGGQLADVLGLALQTVDLQTQVGQSGCVRNDSRREEPTAVWLPTIIFSTMVSLPRM